MNEIGKIHVFIRKIYASIRNFTKEGDWRPLRQNLVLLPQKQLFVSGVVIVKTTLCQWCVTTKKILVNSGVTTKTNHLTSMVAIRISIKCWRMFSVLINRGFGSVSQMH